MDVYRTEEEQLAALKRWWQKNGKSILVGVGLAVALVFGWQAWQQKQQESAVAASELYFNLLEAVSLNDKAQTSTVMHLAEQLQQAYEGQTYAQYGALLAARQAVLVDDLASAEKHLEWAVAHSDEDSSLQLLAKLRLARVVAAQGGEDKLKAALALLSGVEAGAHTASFEEAKGDLYLRLDQPAKAYEAYQRALDAVAEAGDSRPILQMKLNDLANAGAH